MKRSVVHYNYGTLIQRWQELLSKPKLKKRTVHGAAILERGQNFISHFGCNNTATFVFPTTDLVIHLLTSGSVAVFPIQVCIYAAFIHIGGLFWRYILDFFLVCRYFFPVLFPVPCCLFFVLFYTVAVHRKSRFGCIQTPVPFPTGMHPDVHPHRISAFPDLFSGSCDAVACSPNSPLLSTAFPIFLSSIAIP